MFKKLLLSGLLLSNSFTLQANDGWWAFWGALIGSLIDSNSNQTTQTTTIIHIPVPEVVLEKCACGATAAEYKMIKLGCCGAAICDSCWNSRVQKAVRNGVRPKCHACHKTFNINLAQNTAPSAPPAQTYSNNYQASSNNTVMCASGCHSLSEISFKCGHGMCKSCLRSRKANAIKEAQKSGFEVYLTCPNCGDVLDLRHFKV